MADTLTSLLNSTIQAGETSIEEPLLDFLDDLADGTYKVGGGSLTIETVDPVVDEIVGTWTDNGAVLASTDWFTGQETASQGLIDLVTGLGDSSAYFAWDTDTVTTAVAGSTTNIVDTWVSKNAQIKTTAWYGNNAAALAAAEAAKVDGAIFAISGSNAGVTYAYWDSVSQIAKTGSAASTAVQTYATSYVAARSVTTTTVDTLHWDGDSLETVTFQVGDAISYATGVTDGYTLATWDTNKQPLLGMELFGGDIQLEII